LQADVSHRCGDAHPPFRTGHIADADEADTDSLSERGLATFAEGSFAITGYFRTKATHSPARVDGALGWVRFDGGGGSLHRILHIVALRDGAVAVNVRRT
jgi:hypothetical protein